MTLQPTKYQETLAKVDKWKLLGCVAADMPWSALEITFTPATAQKELLRRKSQGKA